MANYLMKRSNCFMAAALNHVFPKWPREMGLSSVILLTLATRRIAAFTDRMIDMSRVYIEKATGK